MQGLAAPPGKSQGGEAALSALRLHGRIVACGGISMYNDPKRRRGPSNLFNVTTKRLTMRGLIVSDWFERHAELPHTVRFLEEIEPLIDNAFDIFRTEQIR